MSYGTRCLDGRRMRHDPQHDDPYLETDLGRCSDCDGEGCDVMAKLQERIDAAERGKVITEFVHPPIPIRQFDWFAQFENDEPDDNGQMLHGTGATEAKAIADLLDKLPPTHCPICGQKDDGSAHCAKGGCPIGGDM